MFFVLLSLDKRGVKFSISFAQKQILGLVLYSPFAIFSEDRMRFGIAFTQKLAFGLALLSPFPIFA